jgi:bla regulator protein BlaR1
MANDLLRLTLCTSLALLLLLVIRTPLRRVLGAVLAYQAWSIVPFITIAACWPNSAAPALHAVATMQVVRALAVQMLPAPSVQIDVLLFLWAGGALPVAAWFVIAHWLFRRRAGPLQRQGNLYFSDGNAGPASVGLLAPIIIVPHDFAQRYTAAGQVLVIAHEQAHIARGDAWANLLQAAFQCVFWFNPLVHLAALRFRQDQELSCDAIVMTQHPHQRRSYAEALLASHRVPLAPQSGIHCHWQSRHPIKERFMQLQSIPPGFPRRLAGRCLVGILATGAVFATLAARAEERAATYSVAMTIDAGDTHSSPRVLAREGEPFTIATGQWRVDMTVRAAKQAGTVWVVSKVTRDGTVIGTPNLLTRVNEQVGVKAGDGTDPFALSMVVTPVPR